MMSANGERQGVQMEDRPMVVTWHVIHTYASVK